MGDVGGAGEQGGEGADGEGARAARFHTQEGHACAVAQLNATEVREAARYPAGASNTSESVACAV